MCGPVRGSSSGGITVSLNGHLGLWLRRAGTQATGDQPPIGEDVGEDHGEEDAGYEARRVERVPSLRRVLSFRRRGGRVGAAHACHRTPGGNSLLLSGACQKLERALRRI